MSVETVDPIEKPGKMKKIIGLLGKLMLAVLLVGGGFAGGYVYFANPLSPTQGMLQMIQPETAGAGGGALPEGGLERVAKEVQAKRAKTRDMTAKKGRVKTLERMTKEKRARIVERAAKVVRVERATTLERTEKEARAARVERATARARVAKKARVEKAARKFQLR